MQSEDSVVEQGVNLAQPGAVTNKNPEGCENSGRVAPMLEANLKYCTLEDDFTRTQPEVADVETKPQSSTHGERLKSLRNSCWEKAVQDSSDQAGAIAAWMFLTVIQAGLNKGASPLQGWAIFGKAAGAKLAILWRGVFNLLSILNRNRFSALPENKGRIIPQLMEGDYVLPPLKVPG